MIPARSWASPSASQGATLGLRPPSAPGSRQSWPAGAGKRKSRRYPGPWEEQHSGHHGGQDHPGPVTHVAGLCSVTPAGRCQCRTQSAPVALHDRPPVTRQLHYNPHLQFGTAYETWRQGVLAQRLLAGSAADGEDVRGRVPQFPPSPQGHRARRRWGLLPPGWRRISPARSARTSCPPRAPTRFSAASWRTSSGPLADGRAQRAG